jgi:hypothetical protein
LGAENSRSATEGEVFYAAEAKDLNVVCRALGGRPAPEMHESGLSFDLAVLIPGIEVIATVQAQQDAWPMLPARWLKSLDRAVALLRRHECEASVPPPALCSGA